MNHAGNVPDHLTDGQAMLESDQFPTQGVVSVLNKSPISNDLRHTFGCALPTRGGVCDCGAQQPIDWRANLDPTLIHDQVALAFVVASRIGAVCDCGAWRTRIDPDLIHDHVGEEDLP